MPCVAVRLADGTTMAAERAVVAVADPPRPAALLDGRARRPSPTPPSTTVPIRMAHLDVALRPLPEPRFPNVLGLDESVYLTVQSDVAPVAPPDGAVIHVGRYLSPGEEDGDHRASLEAILDVAQPDWRDHVVDARYVPRSMVTGDHARWATRGTADRPGVDVAGVDGLALAGDWIGPTGCSPTPRSSPAWPRRVATDRRTRGCSVSPTPGRDPTTSRRLRSAHRRR